jgi:hypothetical protein
MKHGKVSQRRRKPSSAVKRQEATGSGGAKDGAVFPIVGIGASAGGLDAKKPLRHRIYEGLVGGTQTVLQNRRSEVATTVAISGRASDPETSTWALVVGLIQNAFVKAIAHGFEPQAKDASP